MSVVLLVGSQSQLSLGMPWLNAFAAKTGYRPDLLVLGEEHQTLLLHCQATMRSISAKGRVASVQASAEAVITRLRQDDCRLLVMVDDADDDRLEEEVFKDCGIKSVWLNGKAPPPESNAHIFALDETSRAATSKISRRLLGMMPTLELDRQGLFDQSKTEGSKETHSEKALRLERQRCDKGDLLWVAFGSSPSSEEHYEAGRNLLMNATNATVAMVSLKESWDRSMLARVRYWSSHVAEPMNREARLELARTLSEGSQPNLEFLGLISAAAMLAAFGLLQNSAAVIIGAMLIAPLMTPIMGAGLSLAHGNRPLFRTSLLSIGMGFGGAFVSSFLFGLIVRMVDTPVVTSEMWGALQSFTARLLCRVGRWHGGFVRSDAKPLVIGIGGSRHRCGFSAADCDCWLASGIRSLEGDRAGMAGFRAADSGRCQRADNHDWDRFRPLCTRAAD